MSEVFFLEPGYTQIPNKVLDSLRLFTESEVRILMALCRQTFGYKKYQDTISISQFMKFTGMTKTGVIAGTDGLLKQGVIYRIEKSTKFGKSYEYGFRMEKNTEEDLVRQADRVTLDLKGEVVRQADKEVVRQADTQNKEEKQSTEKQRKACDKSLLLEIPLKLKNNEGFNESWKDWEEHYKQKTGKRMTDQTRKLSLQKCESWGIERAIAAMKHSMECGYQGLFESRATNGARTGSGQREHGKVVAGGHWRTNLAIICDKLKAGHVTENDGKWLKREIKEAQEALGAEETGKILLNQLGFDGYEQLKYRLTGAVPTQGNKSE